MNKYLKFFIMFLFFILFSYFFTCYYVSKETPFYKCDFVEQNLFWFDYSELLKENFLLFFENLKNDLYNLNRNPFSILPLIPFSFFIHGFRLQFIMLVEIFYMFPVMLLTLYLFNKYFISGKQISNSIKTIIVSSVFLCPALWSSVIKGIPDIFGMIPILICWLLYFKYEFNKKLPAKVFLLFSVLIYISFLARRWYSVVILSLFISMIIENIITAVKSDDKFKQLGYTIFHLSVSSLIFFILAFFIQGGYFRRILESELNERAMYSSISIINDVLIDYTGIFVLITGLIGVCFYYKNKLVRFTAMNLAIYIFMFIVVMNNQLLWINHYIYIAVCLCIISCAGLYKLIEIINNKQMKYLFASFIILFNMVNFSLFFLFEFPGKSRILLARDFVPPVKSPNYDKIMELYNYLEDEYDKNPNIKTAMYGLHDDLGKYQFRCINPDGDFAKNSMDYERIVNDDFNDATYDEDYIIVLDPPGSFAPDEFNTKIQEVLKMFQNNVGIAKNYRKVKSIELSDNNKTVVSLYKKL